MKIGARSSRPYHTPTSRTGLTVEPLFDETLLLVTSDRERGWPDAGYIHIDWGPEFHAQFSDHHPESRRPPWSPTSAGSACSSC